jgi:nucleoside-diphosphate-sugar epimerase
MSVSGPKPESLVEARASKVSERVLVTGASGFIGASLVDLLLEEGHDVFALVRPGALGLTGTRNLTVLGCDLGAEEDLRHAIASVAPTVSFHLAWRGEPVEYLTSVLWNFESVRFGLTLVEALLEGGCQRIVCAGSCAEYALGPKRLHEDSPTRPGTLYGAAKLALGTAVTPAASQSDASLAWARIFYVYGPREDPRRAVPQIVREALAGRASSEHSRQRRDFLFVHDVASALATLARHGVHGPVNVCSGESTSLHEISSTVQEILAGRDAPVTNVDADEEGSPPIVGDPSALAQLGWQPKVALRAGLTQTIAWWREAEANSGSERILREPRTTR